MQVSVENTSQLGRRVTINIPDVKLSSKVEQRLHKLGREIKLPGFRKGHIPYKVVEKRFSKSVRSEVIGDIINEQFPKALNEQKLNPAGTPVIEKINEENDAIEIIATFEVFPEIVLADLSKEEVEKPVVTVTKENVEKMLDKLKIQFCDFEKVERPCKGEDKLLVDLTRQLNDGHHPHPSVQKNINVYLKKENLVPGMYEELVGKKAGEEVKLSLIYPEDWKEEHDAGLNADFHFVIHQVLERKPMTDEELAEKMHIKAEENASLVESLHKKVQERMEEEVKQTIDNNTKEKVLELLLDKNPIELPKALIEKERETILREFDQRLKNHEHVHLPEEADLNDMAQKRVALGLLINQVVEQFKVTIPEDKVRAQAKLFAMRFGGSDEIVNFYMNNKELRQGIERQVLLDEAVETLLKQLVIKEKAQSFDEVMD